MVEMAHIFISYSRIDKPFTERFAARLARMFPDVAIRAAMNHLQGGDVRREEILDQIAQVTCSSDLAVQRSV